MCLFFFFKQKTAYEMRISDWSSDVCSSDLIRSGAGNPMENTQGSIAIEFRQGWGWLVLAALTISTIGDEITLLTLMFRTAESARAYGVPALLIAELLPGLIAAPWAGRLIDRRGAGRVLVVVSALQAAAIAL